MKGAKRALAVLGLLAAIYGFFQGRVLEGFVCAFVAFLLDSRGLGRIFGSLIGLWVFISGHEVSERASRTPTGNSTDNLAAKCSVTEAFETLGASRGDDPEKIRHKYLEKVAQWHPDKLDGMDPQLKRYATEHTARINIAYDLLHQEGYV